MRLRSVALAPLVSALLALVVGGCGTPGKPSAPPAPGGVSGAPAATPPATAARSPAPAPEKPAKQLAEEARLGALLGGKPAPSFVFEPVGGEPFALESLRGRVVLLDFWATWCSDCTRAAPKLARLWERFRDREVSFLGVATDRKVGPGAVRAAADEHGLGFPQMAGEEARAVSKRYGVQWIPTMVVLDRQGRVRRLDLDLDHGADQTLAATLRSLLAEPAEGTGE